MEQKVYTVDIAGYEAKLPIMSIGDDTEIAFFNLHGAQEMTEHCAKALVPLVKGADVIITAESKGLQLAHCVARELGHKMYAVARKAEKLYLQDGIKISIKSITTQRLQTLYLSAHDVNLIRGKKVAIIDDVISTGGSLDGLEALVEKAGGEIFVKAFVLAEGPAADRTDIKYLAKIPLF